jgi:outer membrane protein TolC
VWPVVLQRVQQKTLRKPPVLLLLLFLVLFQVLFPMSTVLGAEPEPYPEILTLEYALAQASGAHPQLQIAASKIDENRALSDEVDAQIGLQSQLSARLRWIDPPSIAPDQSSDDHWVSLSIDKSLYDFGRHSAQIAASKAAILSAEQEYRAAENQQRINILTAYFDVLLADQAYARDNEDMSMGYVHMDRVRQRNELGQLSDIELTAARSEYQASRVRRYRSSVAQRTTRSQLANVLDRPGQLPGELQAPTLDILKRPIPEDINAWVEEAEQNNVRLAAYRFRVEQVNAQLNAARASDNPRLTGSAEVSRYSRELGSNDRWRAGVLLEVPLSTGGRSDAERARYRAEMMQARAELEQQRRNVSQAILETWGELQSLKVAQQSAQAETEFRDLYLDRSRALYELEVTSDLGDAMVKTTAVRYQTMKTNFMMALAWARLDALLGRKVFAEQPDTSAVQMEKDS